MKRAIKLIVISLFLTRFLYGCQNSSETDENKLITFDLNDLPEIVNIKLSDLGIEDVAYLPLQTAENSIISDINDVIFGEGFFIVKSYSGQILKFQSNGSFVTKIGTKGRGPNFLTQALVDTGIGNSNMAFIVMVLVAQLILSLSQTANGLLRNWISLHVTSRVSISLISDFLIKQGFRQSMLLSWLIIPLGIIPISIK